MGEAARHGGPTPAAFEIPHFLGYRVRIRTRVIVRHPTWFYITIFLCGALAALQFTSAAAMNRLLEVAHEYRYIASQAQINESVCIQKLGATSE